MQSMNSFHLDHISKEMLHFKRSSYIFAIYGSALLGINGDRVIFFSFGLSSIAVKELAAVSVSAWKSRIEILR